MEKNIQGPAALKIRRAENRDTEAVMSLLLQVGMVHHKGRPDLFSADSTKYRPDQLREIFADDDRPVFVCTDSDDRVLGYAFCVMEEVRGDNILCDRKTLYIDDLCVDEKLRGKEIGTTLYNYVADYAKKAGCYNLTLNVWSCNPAAMSFYEKCGLVPQKTGMEKIL